MIQRSTTHSLAYRQLIVERVFTVIRTGASAAIVGASSMGKSRLLHFLMQSDVREHYLGLQSAATLFIWADHHRLANQSEWAFYELLLTAMVEACENYDLPSSMRRKLMESRDRVIESTNGLLARRNVELATVMLHKQGYKLCFLLDEFDETYRSAAAQALTNLRAIRDWHKYQVCFILMLRDRPDRLRPPSDHEGFYELFSQNILGLGPYQSADAIHMMQFLESREAFAPTRQQINLIMELSGKHPGLMLALFNLTMRLPMLDWSDWPQFLLAQPAITDECYKLWNSLADDECGILIDLVDRHVDRGDWADQALRLKGIIDKNDAIFSPIFAEYVRHQPSPAADAQLVLMAKEAIVYVGRRKLTNLTRKEFELLQLLYDHEGEVLERSRIIADLYPDEHHDINIKDNRIDSLMRHLRKKIETDPSEPQYLMTVWGQGYRLTTSPNRAN
ncbi:MAG: winged helix-turn-helix domain-containing protein [Candidatus Promineifilaceae bacterium]